MPMLNLRILLKFLVHGVRICAVFQKAWACWWIKLLQAQAAAILLFGQG